ncbi:MAG: lysophospholipase, partial [Planctomycetales bacterium]
MNAPGSSERGAARSAYFIGLSATLFLMGIGLAARNATNSLAVESITLENAAGKTLRARLHLPTLREGLAPGVLLCHGVNESKETMERLGQAFAREGFAALAFDFGGHGESYRRGVSDWGNEQDAIRALAALRSHPAVDSQRLAAVGHSMGVHPAQSLAIRDKKIHALVAVGMTITTQPPGPPNLLLASGVHDQLHSPDRLLQGISPITKPADPRPGVRYGSFKQRTACRVYLSPRSDHMVECHDPLIAAASVRWVKTALRIETADPTADWIPWDAAAHAMLLVGG